MPILKVGRGETNKDLEETASKVGGNQVGLVS